MMSHDDPNRCSQTEVMVFETSEETWRCEWGADHKIDCHFVPDRRCPFFLCDRNLSHNGAHCIVTNDGTWVAVEPAYMSWETVAMILADRMENHAYCFVHKLDESVTDCAFCKDRKAFEAFRFFEAYVRKTQGSSNLFPEDLREGRNL